MHELEAVRKEEFYAPDLSVLIIPLLGYRGKEDEFNADYYEIINAHWPKLEIHKVHTFTEQAMACYVALKQRLAQFDAG